MSARRKQFSLAKPSLRQSAKTPTNSRIDETRTAVSAGLSASKTATEPIEISSDSSSHYSGSDNEEGDSDAEVQVITKPTTQPLKESRASGQKATPPEISKLKQDRDEQDEDVEMGSPRPQDDPEQGEGSDAEVTSPTFGDLVRGTSTIDVTSTLAAQASGALARRPDATQRSAALTNSTSLGTVLNQALKSDDSDLLESCLQVNDHTIIQNTINRMDSALAAVLLTKLAARMHRRPGRAFGLMKWMQMTLITHGGSLVTQPDLVKRLGELSRVLEERSRGLPSLLSLKGKLDMLDAQMKFRKSIKDSKREHQDESDEESEEDEDEPGVVYVEGQESHAKALTNGAGASRAEEDDFLVANGINEDSDDESFDEADDDVVEELADVESLDEDEVDHDDVEESGEDDDGEEAPPPAKLQKTSSKFAKRK
ncbi:Dip2/Utp12 family-domain-containing protein [Lasiosphaeris hirsuta]|uniref:Dip2/Utp12 family-domain-containing protein n=1 Tax=Lasiosphaeris hirsuta TaxID=260670 RepID=A0AA39ZXU9_9PEZI|nr:Dip2/Utp12 family-domain-containing protein [Lasiosphaeris hirsuta]